MSRIEEKLVWEYAEAAATVVAEKAVAGLSKCSVTLSGDDSGLRNAWEEVCVQVQGEESFFWDTYQQFMHDIVLAELEKMPNRDLVAMWLQTDAGWDWHSDFEYEHEDRERGTPTAPYGLSDIADFIVEDRLLSMAETYSNRNIRAYLGDGASEYEDEEEDDEEEEEDQDNDQDDEELRERLVALMPRDSIVMDLWNWDIHFEELSFDDLTEVAFADGDELAHYAGVLADDFLRWIDEHGMDYNEQDWPSHEEFAAWIRDECLDFMTKWRANVKKDFLR